MSKSRRSTLLAVATVAVLMVATIGSLLRGDASAAREFAALILLTIIVHEVTPDA